MPDLTFEIIGCRVKEFAITPTLAFQLQVTNAIEHEEVYAAALKCQVMVESVKRTYNEETKDRLHELFGPPERWDETLRQFFWQIINIPVPRFKGQTVIEFTLACSEDQVTSAGKYFYAVRDGLIPLAFLFSGTLFYSDANGNLQVTLVSWEKEALCKMPARLWQEMMDIHFPNMRWLRVSNELYQRLVTQKSQTHFPTLEMYVESILEDSFKQQLSSTNTEAETV